MADVFLSYVHTDQPIAAELARGLENTGFSVWWDRHIQAGTDFSAEIERELADAKAVVVLWSAASRDSGWVRDEAAYARDRNKLIPVRLDAVEPPLGFRQIQTLDLHRSGAVGTPLPELEAAIRRTLGREVSQARASSSGVAIPRLPLRWKTALFATVLLAVLVAALVIVWMTRGEQTTTASQARIGLGEFELIANSDVTQRFSKRLVGAMQRVLGRSDIQVVTPERKANEPVDLELRATIDQDDELRVTVVLHSPEGLPVWSNVFASNSQTRFEDQVAVESARVVRCTLDIRQEMSDGLSSTLLPDVLRYCDWSMRDNGSAAEISSVALRIRDAAPQYAISHAVCAAAYAGATRDDLAEPANARSIATICATRARELDPDLGLTYLALAGINDPSLELREREAMLQKCLAVERRDRSSCEGAYGYFLTYVGRKRDGLRYLQHGVGENPLAFSSDLVNYAFETADMGYMNDAREIFQTTEETWGAGGRQWFWAEHYFGDPAVALDRAEKRHASSFSESTGIYGGGSDAMPCIRAFLNARGAHKRMSEQEIGYACRQGGQDPIENIYAYFGHVDAAYRELEGEWDRYRYPGLMHELFRPYYRSVRADVRFMPFVARLGLVDYWMKTDSWPDFCANEALPYDCKKAAAALRPADDV